MSFGRTSLGSSATGGRSTGAGGQRPLSDINVTPLVDVMLVLLVIFIITAPLMASSIKLDLPRTDAGQPTDTPKFVSLSVDAAGKVSLNNQPVTNDELATRLVQAATDHRDTEVQLRADQTVPYGRVVELMGIANKAGLTPNRLHHRPPRKNKRDKTRATAEPAPPGRRWRPLKGGWRSDTKCAQPGG